MCIAAGGAGLPSRWHRLPRPAAAMPSSRGVGQRWLAAQPPDSLNVAGFGLSVLCAMPVCAASFAISNACGKRLSILSERSPSARSISDERSHKHRPGERRLHGSGGVGFTASVSWFHDAAEACWTRLSRRHADGSVRVNRQRDGAVVDKRDVHQRAKHTVMDLVVAVIAHICCFGMPTGSQHGEELLVLPSRLWASTSALECRGKSGRGEEELALTNLACVRLPLQSVQWKAHVREAKGCLVVQSVSETSECCAAMRCCVGVPTSSGRIAAEKSGWALLHLAYSVKFETHRHSPSMSFRLCFQLLPVASSGKTRVETMRSASTSASRRVSPALTPMKHTRPAHTSAALQ